MEAFEGRLTLAGHAEDDEDELRRDDKGGLREQDVPAPRPSHSYRRLRD